MQNGDAIIHNYSGGCRSPATLPGGVSELSLWRMSVADDKLDNFRLLSVEKIRDAKRNVPSKDSSSTTHIAQDNLSDPNNALAINSGVKKQDGTLEEAISKSSPTKLKLEIPAVSSQPIGIIDFSGLTTRRKTLLL